MLQHPNHRHARRKKEEQEIENLMKENHNMAKEINIPLEQNEEIRIQKTEERFRNLWDNFKCSNIQIIRVPEGEEEEQEIENLFEK